MMPTLCSAPPPAPAPSKDDPIIVVSLKQNATNSSNINNNSTIFLRVRASTGQLYRSGLDKTSSPPRHLAPPADSGFSLKSSDLVPSPSPPRKSSRKPSPGLAARLKALGFGNQPRPKAPTTSTSTTPEPIGRITHDHLRHLEKTKFSTSAASQNSNPTRRGRAWSGSSTSTRRARPPKIIGDTSVGFSIQVASGVDDEESEPFFEDDARTPEVRSRRKDSDGDIPLSPPDPKMVTITDSQKYRLPDHTNGNGTKATPETRQAHVARESVNGDDDPPPTLSKNDLSEPPTPGEPIDVSSYFNPFGLQRSGSIYTLSRVSFANQLAQLTSLQLPDAGSLSSKVSAIPTAQAASRALMGAAEQIRSWISKASEVLGGLDADDDVEWAAADGREGLAEVDNAITRFEELINVYVIAIEELQNRKDVETVASNDLNNVLTQVETIVSEWEKIKENLTGVKAQVEIAMEWEELWNTVLGDIGNEVDILKKLVFEMEEKRHRSLAMEQGNDGVDIGELETIVEETPQVGNRMTAKNNRFSVNAGFPMSPNSPSTPNMAQDDSSLLALFARMQPLRASLDFLPMRLSTFMYRAEKTFPTACKELDTRREGLESTWKQLEKDAESLRRELGEDRWVIVFKGAARQAQKMYESVDRSVEKLREAVDAGNHASNLAATSKKIEAYETKKLHYGPAIERVLAIIDRGVKDRLTVNGEIVRLHNEMQNKWGKLKSEMADLDIVLDDLQAEKRNQQLRDSVSSLMSNDRSTIGSLGADTPSSSPASSVIMSSMNGTLENSQSSLQTTKPRSSTISKLPALGASNNRRSISTPSQLPRKGLTNRVSSYGFSGIASPPSIGRPSGAATPTGVRGIPRPTLGSAADSSKPRWNSSVKTEPSTIGHNYKSLTSNTTPGSSPTSRPLSRLTGSPPSAHQNRSISYSTPSAASKIPMRSPLSSTADDVTANVASSPLSASDTVTTPSRPTPSRNISRSQAIREVMASPGPYSQFNMSSPSIAARPRALQNQASTGNLANNRRASYQPGSATSSTSSVVSPQQRPSLGRPASSLAMQGSAIGTGKAPAGRRTSMLPAPRGRTASSGSVTASAIGAPAGAERKDSSVTGRESPVAVAGARAAVKRGVSGNGSGSVGGTVGDRAKWK